MRRHIGARPLVMALVIAVVASLVGPTGPAVADDVAALAATGSISGTVTVPAGVDASQVRVDASYADLSGYAGWTYAAADGTYAVDGLAPGSYHVTFNGWGAGLIYQHWEGTAPSGQPGVVTVGSGPVTGVDVRLTLGATLSGTIRSTSDCDLTGVQVTLASGTGMVYPDAVVQPDGRWSLRAIPTSSVLVVFDGRYVGLPRQHWSEVTWLTVTAGQTRTGIDVTLDGPRGCVALQPYVVQVYDDLLLRYPDWEGLSTWLRLLVEGAPYRSVANAITASDEYRSRLVRATYQRYLGRDAESAGLAFWLGQMRNGRQIEEIQAGFIASDEYYARYGSSPGGWVVGLYRTVLGREPSGSEVQYWMSRINGGLSRGGVARGFLYSTEHLTAVVDEYYLDLLERHIDPSGQTTWVGLIQGGHRDEEIVAAIVSSREYLSSVGR